jgi:hypothetical protein
VRRSGRRAAVGACRSVPGRTAGPASVWVQPAAGVGLPSWAGSPPARRGGAGCSSSRRGNGAGPSVGRRFACRRPALRWGRRRRRVRRGRSGRCSTAISISLASDAEPRPTRPRTRRTITNANVRTTMRASVPPVSALVTALTLNWHPTPCQIDRAVRTGAAAGTRPSFVTGGADGTQPASLPARRSRRLGPWAALRAGGTARHRQVSVRSPSGLNRQGSGRWARREARERGRCSYGRRPGRTAHRDWLRSPPP